MRRVLGVAAVGEVATGLALVIVPSLVGRLLLGGEPTGVAIPVAAVWGRLPAGPAPDRHFHLPRRGHTVPRLRRLRGPVGRRAPVARGRPARDHDGPVDSGTNKPPPHTPEWGG